MRNHLHRRLSLALALACVAAACTCGEVQTKQVGKMVLTIDSPMDGDIFQTGETVDYHASAADELGIKAIELHAGGADGVADQTLQTCAGMPEGSFPLNLTCDFALEIKQHADLIGNGKITLTAIALDRYGLKTRKTITVRAKPIVVRFKLPAITPNTDPPVARVSGHSALTIEVVATNAITAVGVSDENNNVIVQWRSNPTPPFSANVIWTDKPGVGQHHLTANASDDAGNVDSDTRDVLVACAQDSDCANDTGTRCCPEDGLCHQMVAANQDCDCAHPCPFNQGCFPGTCGQTPQKCRPGCFPGDPTSTTAHPYGLPADRCARQDGQPAYCSPLPAEQANAENKGGACAVGDDCDVTTQNCPDLPLDRTQPPGPNNPPVKQTCGPVAPGVNACKPSGQIAPWGINCSEACGVTEGNCPQGYSCVSLDDGTGRRIGPSVCRKECTHPGLDPSPDCPSARSGCSKVFTAGMVYFSSGVCIEEPCLRNSDCAGFSATPCCKMYTVAGGLREGVCDVCN